MTNEELIETISQSISEHIASNIDAFSKEIAMKVYDSILEADKSSDPVKTIQDMKEDLSVFEEMRKEIFDLRVDRQKLIASRNILYNALKPFADESTVGPMPGESDDPRMCSMKFLQQAKTACDEALKLFV